MNILITGCSKGLGWGLATYYMAKGHEVWGMSRSTPEDLIADPHFHFLPQDVNLLENNPEAFKEFIQDLPHVDRLILNAGILGSVNDVKDQDLEEFRRVMETNVFANKTVIDLVLATIPQVDRVIGISSGASISGNRGWGAYGLSKAALNMLMKLYASENEKTTFYAFAPGLIDTAMQDYIIGEVDGEKFTSAKRLKAARKTDAMPNPQEAGRRVAEGIEKLDVYESGAFVDIRKMHDS